MMKSSLIFAAGVWACFTGLNTIDNMRNLPAPAAAVASFQQPAIAAETGALTTVEILDVVGHQTLVKTEDDRRFFIDGIWGAKGESFRPFASQLKSTQWLPDSLADLTSASAKLEQQAKELAKVDPSWTASLFR